MARRLAANVLLRNPETGANELFEVGSTPPEWATEAITNDAVWASSQPDTDGDVPAKSASKGDWVDHAVARGVDRDEAEAMTKDQLVNEYS